MKKSNIAVQTVYFKRWTRKKYAVFNSLKRLVAISTIALACSFIAKPTSSHAQIDTLMKRLNEITVNDDGDDLAPTLAAPILQISIAKSEIERAPVQSINDLLDQIQGLDIRQRGTLNTQADISYRGANFDQTILLLNGFNMTDPQTGHYALNLPIHPSIIHKIDLYNNNTAFLYGTAPFSGLVNIITRPDNENNVAFHLAGGMFGWLSTGVALHLKSGKFRHLTAVDYSQSNGYKHNTDFKTLNAFYQTIGRFQSGELEIQAGYSGREYGANGFYSLKYPDQYETVHTAFTGLKWKHFGRVFWSPSFYYRTNLDCFELVKGQNPQKNNYHWNQTAGVNFLTYFLSKAGKTSFSADVRAENVFSSSLGIALKERIKTLNDTIFYNYGKINLNSSLSASQHYEKKGWTADLALLVQHFTHTIQRLYALPAAYLAYQIPLQKIGSTNLIAEFKLSGSETMRMPTFTDLYYKTGDIVGNTELKPEKARNLELGFHLRLAANERTPYFKLSANWFNRWGRNMIDYIKSDTDIKWRSINHTSIHFQGIEVAATYKPNLQFNDKFFITNIAIEYTYLYSDKNSQGFQSRYVLDHLTHQLTFRLSHRIYKGLSLDYSFSINRRKGEYTSYKTNTAGTLAKYPVSHLLDIRMQYVYRALTFYIEATNVLNQKYFDVGDLEQPGIWLRGGFKCKLGF